MPPPLRRSLQTAGRDSYGYDLATSRHIRTCTANSEVAYGYDELGRLKTVTVLKRNGSAVNALARQSFWKGEAGTDKTAAYQTLFECLVAITKTTAPLAPFLPDEI